MKYVYPAIFTTLEDGYSVKIPALPGCITEGDDLANAIEMARDAAAMWLSMSEDSNEQIPEAVPLDATQLMENQFISLIDADTMAYRIENDSRAVKKTLTIPSWLNQKAEKAGVNFSQVLQAALRDCLGLAEKKGA